MDNIVRSAKPQSVASKRRPLRRWQVFMSGLILIALIGGFVWWTLASGGERVRADRYQAVFLSDGKVFFGKIQNLHGSYVTLKGVYYTQDQQSNTPTAAESSPSGATNNVRLVKVGSEVYGPEHSMNIRSESILFWQNLQPDSKVAQAIASQSN